jgi:hypothetical protein
MDSQREREGERERERERERAMILKEGAVGRGGSRQEHHIIDMKN